MTVRTDQIRSLREASDSAIVAIDDGLGEHKSGDKVLATSGRFAEFKAAYGWIVTKDDGIAIDSNCAARLGVRVGDTITHVARW
jgi:arginine/ornithine N-succinyltransferase beta subunit